MAKKKLKRYKVRMVIVREITRIVKAPNSRTAIKITRGRVQNGKLRIRNRDFDKESTIVYEDPNN